MIDPWWGAGIVLSLILGVLIVLAGGAALAPVVAFALQRLRAVAAWAAWAADFRPTTRLQAAAHIAASLLLCFVLIMSAGLISLAIGASIQFINPRWIAR